MTSNDKLLGKLKRDYLFNPVEIGDTVVIIRNDYRDFQTGKVVKLGDAKVTIEVTRRDRPFTTTRYYNDIIGVSKND